MATSIIDPTIVGWNCKPLNRRAARSGGSCVNPCCFMKFITAERAIFASSYVLLIYHLHRLLALAEVAQPVGPDVEPDVGHVVHVLARHQPHDLADLAIREVLGEAVERVGLDPLVPSQSGDIIERRALGVREYGTRV